VIRQFSKKLQSDPVLIRAHLCQVGHTSVGPQKLRWPRVPHSLNPSLAKSGWKRWCHAEWITLIVRNHEAGHMETV